jgi:hypothetical protein
MRKDYCKPTMRSEKLAVGVFGSYGGSESGGGQCSPIGWFWPLFGICCGGGGS